MSAAAPALLDDPAALRWWQGAFGQQTVVPVPQMTDKLKSFFPDFATDYMPVVRSERTL
jgi:hypothetical protein